MDELEKEQLESQASAMHSNNYANVLAKFKVNNKVKHRPYQDFLNSQVKRATSVQDVSRRKEMEDLKKRGALDMGNLKANLKTKMKSGSVDVSIGKEEVNKVNEIEENLKDVMGDMGLVEKDKEAQSSADHQPNMRKREIYFEDEDLENGLNKIGFTKETHSDRNKKEDCPGKTKVAKSKGSRKYTVDKGLHKKGKKKVRKDDDAAKRSVRMNRKRIVEKKDIASIEPKMKISNYQYEGEEFIRRKRQEKEAEKAEDSDIMKGLEASGDLTVSGNKSPLVALSSNSEESELKKSQEKRDKEELEYEKRLERNIQAKINSIKEEVKREINKLRLDESKKDQQRRKREVINTLLDEETSVLDPDLNIDHQLEPHIRKRRDTKKQKFKQGKRDLNNKENIKGQISMSKMVREATKPKNVAKDHQRKSNQKVKRSNSEALEIKKESENEKPMDKPLINNNDVIAKREDKTELDEIIKKIEKRGHQNHTLAELNEKQVDTAKNIEKRNIAFVATDKIETDIKAEFGTDAPGSIVKRNNDLASLSENIQNKSISDAGLFLVKRSEKHFDATTDRCLEITLESKSSLKNSEDNENRESRSSNGEAVNDLETGQTILKDIDLDTDREERQLSKTNVRDKENSKNENDSTDSEGKQDEEEREERSPIVGKSHEVEKQEKLPVSHKTLRRNSESEKMEGDLIKSSIAETNANEELAVGKMSDFFNAEQSDAALSEDVANKKEGAVKKSDFRNDASELTDESSAVIEERSIDNHKIAMDESKDAADEGNSFERGTRKTFVKPTATNFHETNNEEDSLTDEINEEVVPIGLRRKRRTTNSRGYRNRRKRDENSYSENNNEILSYRGDEGEVDDEDDEMHDDGFDDQTANFLSKRQADYDNSDTFEGGDEQEARNEDYPLYMERNKRNALRVYDDESDAEESYDNFLFYPNRYSRIKRHNYNNLAAIHGGGGMTRHAAAMREKSMQPYEQSLRRKRLEKMQRMHDQNVNVAELSDSDIFGGFPQSYEGELTRFKRVKRSHTK
ncbi:hypothetical protein AMK59_5471 [Oryctes borbonicus]|uniref:Uncharacterized protein n=1 Tax=Oryctes borbonicus TaxID=1629725 RepID=A0A0T6B112_9SCAR|nr:hypothetical protein AMK59_5471 [Oryctes borbonicus]